MRLNYDMELIDRQLRMKKGNSPSIRSKRKG